MLGMRLGGFIFACWAMAIPGVLVGTQAAGVGAAEQVATQVRAPILGASMAAPPQVVVDYAPRLRLHPNESYWPLSSHTSVDHSDIKWSHNNCGDHTIDTTVAESSMAGAYNHRQNCDDSGTRWYSDDIVLAFESGGPSADQEAMYLNINNDYHDGQGFSGTEPVYYRYVPGVRIEYYFHYAYSYTDSILQHEGDWEHIAIALNSSNQPTEIEYFYHHDVCTLTWLNAPKASGGRPIVWIAEDAHGSYPQNGTPTLGDNISGNGQYWDSTVNLDNYYGTANLAWWGYGGGWGEVGSTGNRSGPWGPNPHRNPPSFPNSPRCVLNP